MCGSFIGCASLFSFFAFSLFLSTMKDMPKSRLIIIGIIGFVILFFALVLLGILPGRNQNTGSKVSLTVWGVEPLSAVSPLLTALESRYSIKYQAFDPATYEATLVNALAAGTGPD